MEFFISYHHYWIIIITMMTALFILASHNNLIKKIVALNIFQNSVFLFYISIAKVRGATAPILLEAPETTYSNPLPHVLILTAIVVAVASTAVGLTLILRIYHTYGTIEEDDMTAQDTTLQEKENETQ